MLEAQALAGLLTFGRQRYYWFSASEILSSSPRVCLLHPFTSGEKREHVPSLSNVKGLIHQETTYP